jgi:Mn2+/Fe2+ NRAMP family transporter
MGSSQSELSHCTAAEQLLVASSMQTRLARHRGRTTVQCIQCIPNICIALSLVWHTRFLLPLRPLRLE